MKTIFPPGEISEEQFNMVMSDGGIRQLPSSLLTCVYHENLTTDLQTDMKKELTIKGMIPSALALRMMQDTFLALFGLEETDGADSFASFLELSNTDALTSFQVQEEEKNRISFELFHWDLYKHAYKRILITEDQYQILGYRKNKETVDLILGILEADSPRSYGSWHGSFLGLYRDIVKQFVDYTWAASYINMEDSHELIDGPDFLKNPSLAKKDESYEAFYARQMEKPAMQEFVKWFLKASEDYELALPLENRIMYQKYLQSQAGNPDMPLHYDRIYVGNSWCRFQFPSKEMLFQILEQAKDSHQKVTLVWPLLDADWEESARGLIMQLIGYLADQESWFADSFEMVGNDVGMLSLLSKIREESGASFLLASGLLLEKRMRDPRMQYTKIDYEILRGNQFQQPQFMGFLKRLGVSRFECSSCGYEAEYPQTEQLNKCNTLHLPLYQTNTGQACPLLALCQHGDRAKQDVITGCKGECQEYAITYQAYLDIIGVYNSVFAVDKKLIENPGLWKTFAQKGVDRLVFNLNMQRSGMRMSALPTGSSDKGEES